MAIFVNDYWRDEEEKRQRQESGTQPLLGHEMVGDSSSGFDEDKFNIDLIKERIRSRGMH